jgi:hypothetical protein
MQYSASNPVRTEIHFSALHHGDYDVLWGAELWFVVCDCWRTKQRVRKKKSEKSIT